MSILLKHLAEIASGHLEGDGSIEINSAAPIETASEGQITFIANNKYKKYLKSTHASAVVLGNEIDFDRTAVIRHKSPYFAFALILDELYPDKDIATKGVDRTSVVSESANLGKDCAVGALAFVGEGSSVGNGTVIYPQVYIGNNVTIGKYCTLYPGVILYDDIQIGDNTVIHGGTIVGSDGFGYAEHDAGLKKVRQVGCVEIGSDVEIGANCTIDRGALGPTRIGNGVKIDNLVQIAHNVQIGDYSIIVAQVGISGSTKLGKGVILAGQVGLVGHIELGDGVKVAAQSGVSKDIPAGKVYFGCPAREIAKTRRIEACLSRLPDLFKRVRNIEKK